MWYVIYIIIYCTKYVFWILLKYVWKLFWAFLIFLNIRSMCLCGSSSGSTRLIWWRGRAAIGGKVRYCSFSPYSHSSFFCLFSHTRSYAALRAADLDWIVGPGSSLERVHSGEKQLSREGGRAGISKNVTDAGSQLPWKGGGAGISKNVTDAGSQLTF